jgi:hypothetical protein
MILCKVSPFSMNSLRVKNIVPVGDVAEATDDAGDRELKR